MEASQCDTNIRKDCVSTVWRRFSTHTSFSPFVGVQRQEDSMQDSTQQNAQEGAGGAGTGTGAGARPGAGAGAGAGTGPESLDMPEFEANNLESLMDQKAGETMRSL